MCNSVEFGWNHFSQSLGSLKMENTNVHNAHIHCTCTCKATTKNYPIWNSFPCIFLHITSGKRSCLIFKRSKKIIFSTHICTMNTFMLRLYMYGCVYSLLRIPHVSQRCEGFFQLATRQSIESYAFCYIVAHSFLYSKHSYEQVRMYVCICIFIWNWCIYSVCCRSVYILVKFILIFFCHIHRKQLSKKSKKKKYNEK